jgi:hypothetical protein
MTEQVSREVTEWQRMGEEEQETWLSQRADRTVDLITTEMFDAQFELPDYIDGRVERARIYPTQPYRNTRVRVLIGLRKYVYTERIWDCRDQQ